MEKLTRGKKLCKSCDEINPIRSFTCKKCNAPFGEIKNPKSKKPPKDIVNTRTIIPIKILNRCFQIINDLEIYILSQMGNLPKIELINDNNLFDIVPLNDSEHGVYIKKEFKITQFNECFNVCTTNKNLILNYIISPDKNLNYNITILTLDFDEETHNFQLISIHTFKVISLVSKSNLLKINYVKAIKNSNIFIVIFNEIIQFFLYDKGSLINFYSIKKETLKIEVLSNFYTNIDFFISDNLIKMIVSDNNNTIYLYHVKKEDKTFNLNNLFVIENIYENFFFSDITDLSFLNISEDLKTSNNQIIQKQYFAASAKDGYIKIFDSLNPFESIFKLKISEVWICNFHYENSNQTLFITVNKESKNKIQSVKFFDDNEKEPKFKRINNTENSVLCSYSTFLGKFYYLLENGELYSIDEYLLYGIYKRVKNVKTEGISKLEFSFKNYCIMNNLTYSENLIPKKFSILTNLDGKTVLVIFNQIHIIFNILNE